MLEKMLREFHQKYRHHMQDRPLGPPPPEVVILRMRLIAEEVGETFAAMHEAQDPVEILDGICDAIYVLAGTAVAYGLPLDEALAEVHRSNMTKAEPREEDPSSLGSKYVSKVSKGPDYSPPNLGRIIHARVERGAGQLSLLHMTQENEHELS